MFKLIKTKLYGFLVCTIALTIGLSSCADKIINPEVEGPMLMQINTYDECGTYFQADLKSQGNNKKVGTILFESIVDDGDDFMLITITSTENKKLNNAGVVWRANLEEFYNDGFLSGGGNSKNYNSNNDWYAAMNITNGKVQNQNSQYRQEFNGGMQVQFKIPRAELEEGDYLFIVYCSQGWGYGVPNGPSGNNGNGSYIPLTVSYCEDALTELQFANFTECTVWIENASENAKANVDRIIIGENNSVTVKAKDVTFQSNDDVWQWLKHGVINIALPNLSSIEIYLAGEVPEWQFGGGWISGLPTNTWLKEFIAPNITGIGDYAFYQCDVLEKLEIPSVVTIGNSSFYNCKIQGVLNLPELTHLGEQAFAGNNLLTGVLHLPKVQIIPEAAFLYANFTGLNLPVATQIEKQAFMGNTVWSTVSETLNAPNVIVIQDSAFFNCFGLTTLNLPKVHTISCNAFENCRGLTGELYLPEVEIIAQVAFRNCIRISKLNLPKVTDIHALAFANCYGLTGKLYLPEVKHIRDAVFEACSLLTSVNLPNATHVSGFALCYGLQKVNLPNATYIGISCFYDCRSLTTLNLPKVDSVDRFAFSRCYSLAKIDFLPEATYLGNAAFYECTGIDTVLLPKVTSIGHNRFINEPSQTHGYTFIGCTKLSEIRFLSPTPVTFHGEYNFSSITPNVNLYLGQGEWSNIQGSIWKGYTWNNIVRGW